MLINFKIDGVMMKILIFLFAMITFILMASDPRREDFETRSTSSKKQDSKKLSTNEDEHQEQSFTRSNQDDPEGSS